MSAEQRLSVDPGTRCLLARRLPRSGERRVNRSDGGAGGDEQRAGQLQAWGGSPESHGATPRGGSGSSIRGPGRAWKAAGREFTS